MRRSSSSSRVQNSDLKIAAVEHARQEIVVHVLAAELPLPRGHPVLRQAAARQRCRHLQLPYLALGHDLAPQHAVHLPVAQLVVHHQAVVLPADGCRLLVQPRSGSRPRKRACRVLRTNTLQVLLRSILSSCIFPHHRARRILPSGTLCLRGRLVALPRFTSRLYHSGGRPCQQNAQILADFFHNFVKSAKDVPGFSGFYARQTTSHSPRISLGQRGGVEPGGGAP